MSEDLQQYTNEEDVHKCRKIWDKLWPILFFLIFGILNAVTMKLCFIFTQPGLEKYGPEPRQFQKPWWCTLVTFAGMALATPIYIFLCHRDRKGGRPTLRPISDLSFKEICTFAIPAMADLFEGIVSAICIAFVGVSIDSMMKSGTLVGVSLISRFVFKVHFGTFKWFFIAWIVLALTMVGASGILSANSSETIKGDAAVVTVIIILKFISQVGYALKISYEEYFVKKKNYHPILICGIEGCWSTFVCAFICMPIAQYLPGQEGNGIREDTLDTFAMLGNNYQPLVMSFAIVLLGLLYNCISTTLIGKTSAVVRTLMEAFRTFLIWMVQFMLYYSLRSNPDTHKYALAGEAWSTGSIVQLVGFLIMTWALFGYNKIPKYPCFDYIDDWIEQSEQSEREMELHDRDEPLTGSENL